MEKAKPLDMFEGDMTPEPKTETPGVETVEPAFRYTPVPADDESVETVETPVETPVETKVEQAVVETVETEAPGVQRRTDKGSAKSWEQLYRPDTLNGYIYPDEFAELSIKEIVKTKEVGHLILSGVAGTGKTTLAMIIAKALDTGWDEKDLINASKVTKKEDVDREISRAINAGAMRWDSDRTIIVLDEAEQMSTQAMAALKSLMEQYEGIVSFILTTNYLNKIEKPILSRCRSYEFKSPSKQAVVDHMIKICQAESVDYDPLAVEQVVNKYYPDIRATLRGTQERVIDGRLIALDQAAIDKKRAAETAAEKPVSEQPVETETPRGPSDLFTDTKDETAELKEPKQPKRQSQRSEPSAPRASSGGPSQTITITCSGSMTGVTNNNTIAYNSYDYDADHHDHYYENDEPEQPGLIRRLLRAIVG